MTTQTAYIIAGSFAYLVAAGLTFYALIQRAAPQKRYGVDEDDCADMVFSAIFWPITWLYFALSTGLELMANEINRRYAKSPDGTKYIRNAGPPPK